VHVEASPYTAPHLAPLCLREFRSDDMQRFKGIITCSRLTNMLVSPPTAHRGGPKSTYILLQVCVRRAASPPPHTPSVLRTIGGGARLARVLPLRRAGGG